MLARRIGVGSGKGVYAGWTRAGNARVFARVPTELKERSEHPHSFDSDGDAPELDATPIVLVHGFASSRALKPLIRALGTRGPVYAPDLPGFGMSDQPIRPLDVRDLANALRRWLVENELVPANVIGISFGSQVAVDLAIHHRTAVDRLVLVGPTFDPKARSVGKLARRWARNARHWSPRLAPTVMHDLIDAGPWRSVRTLREALAYRVERKLSRIDQPTLVVRPEHDHLVPVVWAERVAELIPHSELVVLPGAGHSIGPLTAARLTELLGPFLGYGDEEGEREKPGARVRPEKRLKGAAPEPAAR